MGAWQENLRIVLVSSRNSLNIGCRGAGHVQLRVFRPSVRTALRSCIPQGAVGGGSVVGLGAGAG